jgi:hypothetical protein
VISHEEQAEERARAQGVPDPIDVSGLVWQLLPVADAMPSVSAEEVGRRINDGTIFQWLDDEYQVLQPRRDEALFIDYLQRTYNVEQYGIGRSGLLLLVAYCIEAYQQMMSAYQEELRRGIDD